MANKFSISEGMLNGISKNVKKVTELEAKEGFKLEYIDINKIHRSDKNFYEIVDIDNLAEDIKLNGLNHNLVVRPTDKETYEIISGERRFTALSRLVDEGNTQFINVPCKVVILNDVDAEIVLIQANAQTRELSESEKLKQVERLSELYKSKKANGEKVGKIRDAIANDLKLSPTQVGRYERINNKLIPELKELLEQGNLTTANASEFSTLNEENQKALLDILNSKVKLSKNEAIDLKNTLKTLENARELEIKEKHSILQENEKLKAKINSTSLKSKEELKQLEVQLRVEIKEDINNKYSFKIEEVKNEVKRKYEENEKLKNELKELKASSLDNADEIKNNVILKQHLENAYNSLRLLGRHYREMEKNKLTISDDIKDILELALTQSYSLTMIKKNLL